MPQYLNKLTEHENNWQNLGGPRLFRLGEICLSVHRQWCTGKALLFIYVTYHQSPTAMSVIKYKLVSAFYNSTFLNQISCLKVNSCKMLHTVVWSPVNIPICVVSECCITELPIQPSPMWMLFYFLWWPNQAFLSILVSEYHAWLGMRLFPLLKVS